jgi:hypothetical protein
MTGRELGDHLFISYAGEDIALAEWLTLKLTSEGYRVWCDRYKLLGGESYPIHIDDAIKNHTFRVIALLSKNSLSKPNPLKERTLALNIARERNEDFLIPLNIDGLNPSELDWMTSDLTFIPFHESWAKGLKQLLKKLSTINAPRPLKNGKEIVAEIFLNTGFVNKKMEPVYLNCLRISKIPKLIKKFKFNTEVTRYAFLELINNWAVYRKDKQTVFAFHTPPKELVKDYQITYEGKYDWHKTETIDGINTRNIVSNLLYRSIHAELYKKGLDAEKSKLFFLFGLLENDKIKFKSYTGKYTTVQVAGERVWRKIGGESETFLYHLSPNIKIRFDPTEGYLAILTVDLHITDESGEQLRPKSALARSKRIRKNWWNHEWLNRYLAVISFLANDENTIIIGERQEEIVISTDFIKDFAPISIIETDIKKSEEGIEFEKEYYDEEEELDEEDMIYWEDIE